MSDETEWVMLAKRVQRWLEDKYGFLVHVQDVECALRSRYFDDATAPQPPAEAQPVARFTPSDADRHRCFNCGQRMADHVRARCKREAVRQLREVIAPPAEAQAQGGGEVELRHMVAKLAAHVRPTCGELWAEAERLLNRTAPPSAPVGVEDHDAAPPGEDPKPPHTPALRWLADREAIATQEWQDGFNAAYSYYAQQPAADDVDAEQFRKGWQAGFAEGRRDQQPADTHHCRNCEGIAPETCATRQPAACVGCEGKPAPENSPCAVCGQQPAAVDGPKPPKGWRPCNRCNGVRRREKRDDCERCGGSGWRKKCNSLDCLEYGCNGYGFCIVTKEEVTAALAQQPAAGVTHADHVRGLADMLAPEKQADTLRAAADAMPDQQSAAVPAGVAGRLRRVLEAVKALSAMLPDGKHREHMSTISGQAFLALESIEQQPAAVDEVLAAVRAEVARATAKFPTWPTDPLHASGVVQEESGELAKAVLQAVYEPHKSTPEDAATEAFQTAAMAVRFLMSIDKYHWQRGEQHEQSALAAQQGDES